MPDSPDAYSIAVFPFLKTSGPVPIGRITFRPTDDRSHLKHDPAERVAEIAQMLFLQDDLRIRSASYAVVPFIDLRQPNPDVEELKRLQALVAYCYTVPHQVFGDPFLRYEHASLVIFSPNKVSIFLVSPDHHVERIEGGSSPAQDDRGKVQGYDGLYNFRHNFWVTKGSRLYPPIPSIGLNISQDLSRDVTEWFSTWPRDQLLWNLTTASANATADRILSAISWFNAANSFALNEEASIVNLAVAFETLLGLPEDRKTERLIDAVALLLGRIPRLDIWVSQFYRTRSEIVHEGRAHRVRFVATDSRKESKDPAEPLYHPLLSYGRQVFQLCVETLLVGAALTRRGDLEEKFVTNQQRFAQICTALEDETLSVAERLQSIADKVETAERYRFVSERSLSIDTLVGCGRLAAQALLACDKELESNVREGLEKLVAAVRSRDRYEELHALLEVRDMSQQADGFAGIQRTAVPTEMDSPKAIVFRLFDVIWWYTFMHLHWIKENRDRKEREENQRS